MSWDVYLSDGDGVVTVEHHSGEGGTYVMGGTDRAHLNVTWNYNEVITTYGIFDGADFRTAIHGKRADDLIPALELAVKRLGTRKYSDYWAPTPGNVGHMLNILLGWAKQHPDAVFDVD